MAVEGRAPASPKHGRRRRSSALHGLSALAFADGLALLKAQKPAGTIESLVDKKRRPAAFLFQQNATRACVYNSAALQQNQMACSLAARDGGPLFRQT